jgi:hypothetical protein
MRVAGNNRDGTPRVVADAGEHEHAVIAFCIEAASTAPAEDLQPSHFFSPLAARVLTELRRMEAERDPICTQGLLKRLPGLTPSERHHVAVELGRYTTEFGWSGPAGCEAIRQAYQAREAQRILADGLRDLRDSPGRTAEIVAVTAAELHELSPPCRAVDLDAVAPKAADVLAEPDPLQAWTIPQLLEEAAGMTLYGPSYVAKSLMAWYAGMCVARGYGTVLNRTVESDPAPVVLFCGENTRRQVKSGLRKLLAGEPCPETLRLVDVHAVTPFPNLATVKGQRWYESVVASAQPKLAILDSSTALVVADRNKSEVAQDVMVFLSTLGRRYGVSRLLAHHVRKGSPSGDHGSHADRAYGAHEWTSLADTAVLVESERSQKGRIRVHPWKIRDAEPGDPYVAEIDRDTLQFSFCALIEKSKRASAKKVTAPGALDVIRRSAGETVTSAQLTEALGCSDRTLQRFLKDDQSWQGWVEAGVVEVVERNHKGGQAPSGDATHATPLRGVGLACRITPLHRLSHPLVGTPRGRPSVAAPSGNPGPTSAAIRSAGHQGKPADSLVPRPAGKEWITSPSRASVWAWRRPPPGAPHGPRAGPRRPRLGPPGAKGGRQVRLYQKAYKNAKTGQPFRGKVWRVQFSVNGVSYDETSGLRDKRAAQLKAGDPPLHAPLRDRRAHRGVPRGPRASGPVRALRARDGRAADGHPRRSQGSRRLHAAAPPPNLESPRGRQGERPHPQPVPNCGAGVFRVAGPRGALESQPGRPGGHGQRSRARTPTARPVAGRGGPAAQSRPARSGAGLPGRCPDRPSPGRARQADLGRPGPRRRGAHVPGPGEHCQEPPRGDPAVGT